MKTFALNGIVGWDSTPQGLREFLQEANGADVLITVSSPGGFIAPGLEMFNLIRNYPGTVNVQIIGFAMSMASYIPLAAKAKPNPGTIRAEDNAVYMIHNARGGAWGDHNDVLAYGTMLKGLSGVMAKRYVKHTGKTADEIETMMDKETFLFGEEMVTHGFVDEIIDSDDNDADEETALATAKAAFSDCYARMSSDQEQARADWQRAAAMLKEIQPPAAAGQPKKEVQQMTFSQLLADNPAAKAEYDQALANAASEGEKAGEARVRATIDKVTPFLASKEYPAIIGTTALKVLKGEESMVTLTASVAAVDAVREANAAGAAAGETAGAGESNGQQQQPREAGAPIATQEDLDAEVARMKGGK